MSMDGSTVGNSSLNCQPRDGDIAWMLMATVLVLGMFPGVAFFELGLLRKKNTTSILAQIYCGLPILSTMWIMFGYTLTFGPDAGGFGLIGNLSRAFMAVVSFETCYTSATIPEPLFAIFQLMFACITPLLMTGAYAERLAWKPFLLLTIFWEILVYYPIAHWIWSTDGWLRGLGAQDFAGGIVIHTTAGVSSLVTVVLLGKRHNYHKYHGMFPYSSIPMAGVGATLLWTGWFGFNGGSALGANASAVSAVLNTQIAAGTSACVLVSVISYKTGKPSTIAMLNGAIAGLAGVTPASGFITPLSAFFLGIILGSSVEVGVHFLKHKWEIDDALEVSVIHGLTGVIGSLYVGFAGDQSVGGANGVIATKGKDWSLLGYQALAVFVAAVWSFIWTLVILVIIRKFTPLRVEHHHEIKGLDAAIHYETASNTHHDHHDRHDSLHNSSLNQHPEKNTAPLAEQTPLLRQFSQVLDINTGESVPNVRSSLIGRPSTSREGSETRGSIPPPTPSGGAAASLQRGQSFAAVVLDRLQHMDPSFGQYTSSEDSEDSDDEVVPSDIRPAEEDYHSHTHSHALTQRDKQHLAMSVTAELLKREQSTLGATHGHGHAHVGGQSASSYHGTRGVSPPTVSPSNGSFGEAPLPIAGASRTSAGQQLGRPVQSDPSTPVILGTTPTSGSKAPGASFQS